jgi:hypothetical protein
VLLMVVNNGVVSLVESTVRARSVARYRKSGLETSSGLGATANAGRDANTTAEMDLASEGREPNWGGRWSLDLEASWG